MVELGAPRLNHSAPLFRDGFGFFKVFSKPVQGIQGHHDSDGVQKDERLADPGKGRFDLVGGEDKGLPGTLFFRNNTDEIPEGHFSVEVRRQPILSLAFMEESHEVEAHSIISIDYLTPGFTVVYVPAFVVG